MTATSEIHGTLDGNYMTGGGTFNATDGRTIHLHSITSTDDQGVYDCRDDDGNAYTLEDGENEAVLYPA